jgi:autotransporter-associated beta strand protein
VEGPVYNTAGTLALSGNESTLATGLVSYYTWPAETGPATLVTADTGGAYVTAGTLLISGGTFTCPGVASFGSNSYVSTGSLNGQLVMTGGTATFGVVTNANGLNGNLISINGTNAGTSVFNATEVDFYRSGNPGTAVNVAAPLPIDSPTLADGFIVNGPNAAANVGALLLGIGNTGASMMITNGATVTITNKFQVGGEAPVPGGTNARASVLEVIGNPGVPGVISTLNILDTSYGMVIGQNGVTNTYNNSANSGYTGPLTPTYAQTIDEVYLAGGSVTTAGIINFGLASDVTGSGQGFLIVSNATLYVGGGGIVSSNTVSPPMTNVLALNTGAVLGAAASWSNSSRVPIQLIAPAGNAIVVQTADAAGNPHNITLGGAVSGPSGLSVTGGGALTLTGTNTYTGSNNIARSATLVLGGAGLLGALSPTSGNYAGDITNNGTFHYASSGAQILTGNLNGASSVGGLIKDGAGALTLKDDVSGSINSYNGPTIVNNGTLFLVDSVSSTATPVNTPEIVVNAPGVLDVTGMAFSSGSLLVGDPNLVFGATQILAGNGTISGNVMIEASGVLVPGPTNQGVYGNLTITEALDITNEVDLRVDHLAGGPANDSVTAQSINIYSGYSVIKVIQGANDLQAGDKFQLFNSPSLNAGNPGLAGVEIDLPATGPVLGGVYAWDTNSLASDGWIQLVSVTLPLNPNPPTILLTATPGFLTLGWPTNLGWILQYQSNSVGVGLLTNSTDWLTWPNSTTVTQEVIPIGTTNEVFFQMVHP